MSDKSEYMKKLLVLLAESNSTIVYISGDNRKQPFARPCLRGGSPSMETTGFILSTTLSRMPKLPSHRTIQLLIFCSDYLGSPVSYIHDTKRSGRRRCWHHCRLTMRARFQKGAHRSLKNETRGRWFHIFYPLLGLIQVLRTSRLLDVTQSFRSPRLRATILDLDFDNENSANAPGCQDAQVPSTASLKSTGVTPKAVV